MPEHGMQGRGMREHDRPAHDTRESDTTGHGMREHDRPARDS
jgi:hypothetical protein